jgi:hypothetical protein
MEKKLGQEEVRDRANPKYSMRNWVASRAEERVERRESREKREGGRAGVIQTETHGSGSEKWALFCVRICLRYLLVCSGLSKKN